MLLDSASSAACAVDDDAWLTSRGGGTGALVEGTLSAADVAGAGNAGAGAVAVGAAAAGADTGRNGAAGMVGDGAGEEAKDEALEGMDALDGPFPLFHAAALRRASKLLGRVDSVPSLLAITHPPRRRWLD